MADIFDEITLPVQENLQPSIPSDKSEKIAKDLTLFGYGPKPETIEKIRHQLIQKLVTPATEFTSSVLGAPGDVMSFLNEIIARPLTKAITGEKGVPVEEMPLHLPTSGEFHAGFEGAAKEKLRPESITDKLLDTSAGFLGSMIGLGAKGLAKPGTIPFTKKAVKIPAAIKTALNAFAPAAAYVGAKEADLPPWQQAAAAIGTSFLTHRLTNKSLGQISKDLYTKSNELAKDVVIPADKLVSRLDSLQEVMNKGVKTGPKSRINTLISELKDKSSGGVIPLEELIETRKNINEVSKEFTKSQLKGSENFWKAVRSSVDSTIDDYGKLNPEFGNTYREANSLYKGIQESKKMETWIKSHVKESAVGLAGNFLLKHLELMSGISPVKAAVIGKSALFTKSLIKNPGFRKAYKDILKNAANENIRGTARAFKDFNYQAKKIGIDFSEEESKKDIFDELD